MAEELRTLPNGDSMSLGEVEILHNEAWGAYSAARKNADTSPATLKALADKVALTSKTLHGGYEPGADKVLVNRSEGRAAHGELRQDTVAEKALADARAIWKSNPTQANLDKLTQAQKRRFGG